MTLPSFDIGTSVLGIDMMSDQTSLPKGAQRDIVNTDVDNVGNLSRRAGARRLTSTTGAHSLWANRAATLALAVVGTDLCRIELQGDSVIATTLMAGLGQPVRYFEHSGSIYFTDGTLVGVAAPEGTRRLGSPVPTEAPVLGDGEGPVHSVAYSFLTGSGEESGLSAMVTGPSFELQLPTVVPPEVVAVNLYMTPPNGDILYKVGTVPAGMMFVTLTPDFSRAATTQFKTRMTGGSALAVYNGRLYVADDRYLRFSEAFNFGLTDVRTNVIDMGATILFVMPSTTCMFVGTTNGVYVLRGEGPSTFTQDLASAVRPASPGAVYIPAELLDKQTSQINGDVVAWMSVAGIAYGTPSGTVLLPQAKRVCLAPGEGDISFTVVDGVARVFNCVPTAVAGDGVTLGE